MKKITILTPTYNRLQTLPRLFKSLKKQTNKNFQWVIIDDGSIDGTQEYIEKIKQKNTFDIKYYYQENGGKARALNHGFSKIKDTEIAAVIDSDDYLLPEAIKILEKYNKKYKNKNIGGLFFHYENQDGHLIQSKHKVIKSDQVMDRYEFSNKHGKFDGCICYLQDVIRNYKYPEYEDEKYIGPTVLQMEMSDRFKMVFSPEIIGVAEYQKDGLTNSGRRLRLNNPRGMLHYSKLMIDKKSSFLTRVKYALSVWPYANIIGLSFIETVKEVGNFSLLFITYIPGILLTFYWKKNKCT